jgi:DNA polymerase III alpha subunit
MGDVYTVKVEVGSKIYCEGQAHAYKLEEKLHKLNVETSVGCNEVGMWSVYIISVPEKVFQFESKQTMDKLKNYKPKEIDNLSMG